MSIRKRSGKVGTSCRRTVAGMSVPLAAAALLGVTASVAPPARIAPAVTLSADTTALVLCGTTCPTPDDVFVDIVGNQYIRPTHPGDIDYVKVTTPQTMWPFTGVLRLVGLLFGDRRIFGKDGPAWPDQPWWELSGLFDPTASQSLEGGAAALSLAVEANENDHTVIYGLSQGAGVANVVKRRLAEQYATGPESETPDIDFVLTGDPNLPNGGLMSRFPGLYVPILDLLFNGAAATDTPFDTVEITRQYDGFTDFPLYPINLLADLNAVLGIVYLHTNFFDVSLPAEEPSKSPAYRGSHGDSSYYFFETQDLPLFAPLRMFGFPEPLIDVVEPVVRVLVELGYDRTIPQWEPTPARLFPRLDPAKVLTDLGAAIGEGFDNALAIVGLPPRRDTPAPTTEETQAIPAEVVDADAAPVEDEDATDPGATVDPSEPASGDNPTSEFEETSEPGDPSDMEVEQLNDGDSEVTDAAIESTATDPAADPSPDDESPANNSPDRAADRDETKGGE
ncbi:PE-PPE domain-containing protein [Mycolicibacterium sp. BiH015]|uniref:PE-PPE domain-containing protein n=1 Tax=Mycolicibacterium sp. BiH015 TaxID=3018808 RepID=UPI0022DEB4B3|nr:PE-PPE domain-containing protein [Mycolicibacterium sp. BiH015]MDA2894888.1 PE-PPE domain-containing protein [Mycolicibacterium sp. BiH015]